MNLTGRSLKQYQIVGELGAGGMGVVYRARDTVLGRDVAVKVLPADKLQSEESRGRFLREARAASALNHPNVVTIYEIGNVDGIDFIAMEFVAGQTLQSLLRDRHLKVGEAANFASQTADALTKAHAAGVVHRDIKPSNLVITDDGLVKVLDFGLARLNETAADVNASTNAVFATRAGTVMGTVAYMSPEQARGEEAGAASDIFSLGVVLFEMLSGQLPFPGTSEVARLHNLHFMPPQDLRALAPDVPVPLVGLVQRMLEKDLLARCATMAEVRRVLRPFAGIGSSAIEVNAAATPTAPPPPAAVASPRRRTRTMLAGVAAVIAAGVIAAGWMAWTRANSAPAASLRAAEADTFNAETAAPLDLYVKARSLLDRFDREGNVAEAITLLERAVEKDSGFALGHATLTEAYRYRYNAAPDEQWRNLMSQSAQRAVKLNPDLSAAHIAMGLVTMDQAGKTVDAESHLRRAIDLDPRKATAHIWLAILLGRAGQAARAIESLQEALRLDPNNWAALQELGIIHFRGAEYARAAAAWEQARLSSPDNVRVLANLSAAYHMLDRTEEAVSTLQRAIEIQPAPPHYANLGTYRFFQGRYDDAVPAFERAVELQPNRYLYWGNLADAYRWSTANKAKARETYAHALDRVREQLAQKPADPDLRSTQALYLAKSGATSEAADVLFEFDRQVPAQAAILYRLAVAHEVIGKRDRALSMLERAMKAGYAIKEIRAEPELVNLRNDVRYHQLAASTRVTPPTR